MGALHAVEEIQKNRLLSEVTKLAPSVLHSESGELIRDSGESWEDRSFMRSSPMQY